MKSRFTRALSQPGTGTCAPQHEVPDGDAMMKRIQLRNELQMQEQMPECLGDVGDHALPDLDAADGTLLHLLSARLAAREVFARHEDDVSLKSSQLSTLTQCVEGINRSVRTWVSMQMEHSLVGIAFCFFSSRRSCFW